MAIRIILLLLFPIFSTAQITGRVVGVADGDTFTLLTKDKRQIKVRVAAIDCPEKSQDFGQKAKQFTSDQIYNKTIKIDSLSRDRYGRVIANVYLNDSTLLNELLVLNGFAWHYLKYDKQPKYDSLQNIASQNKSGLWAHKEPIEPWNYRRKK